MGDGAWIVVGGDRSTVSASVIEWLEIVLRRVEADTRPRYLSEVKVRKLLDEEEVLRDGDGRRETEGVE